MLCWFYRAAAILCTFCPVRLVTHAALSDCAYQIGNMNVDEEFEMQGEEVEVNVKIETGIGCEEEEGIGIKDEEGVYSEAEEEEEVYIDIKEEEDVGIKEEVSLQGTVLCVMK